MPAVLFVKTSSLGDVIHHMPAITDARRRLPDAHFAWVVEEAYAPLVALHPAVNAVIPVASRRWRRDVLRRSVWHEVSNFLRSLRTRNYDHIVDTQGLIRSALIAKLARGRRHGYDAASIREPIAARFYDVCHTVPRNLHAIARNRTLTALALGYQSEGPPNFGLQRERFLAGSSSSPYAVLLHATARREKEWSEPNWMALAKSLEQQGLSTILPWGTAEERGRSERLAVRLPAAKVPERLPLDSVVRLLAGASVVIGVDTGLLHLAAALAVPLVAIFVGSEPGLTGPMGEGPVRVVGGKGTLPSAEEVIAAAAEVFGRP